MIELPCVGAGITVVDPGPSSDDAFRKREDGRPSAALKKKPRRSYDWRDRPLRLLRAFVTDSGVRTDRKDGLGAQILWRCGKRDGYVFESTEGTVWTRGHGPQARGALLAQRALAKR